MVVGIPTRAKTTQPKCVGTGSAVIMETEGLNFTQVQWEMVNSWRKVENMACLNLCLCLRQLQPYSKACMVMLII